MSKLSRFFSRIFPRRHKSRINRGPVQSIHQRPSSMPKQTVSGFRKNTPSAQRPHPGNQHRGRGRK